jgi:hypothetical protein
VSHHLFLAKLDALGTHESVFAWEDDGKLVLTKLPREAWESAGRPLIVTVVLADLTGSRIDDAEALANAWDDGYKHGRGDERRDDDMRAANPHWTRS